MPSQNPQGTVISQHNVGQSTVLFIMIHFAVLETNADQRSMSANSNNSVTWKTNKNSGRSVSYWVRGWFISSTLLSTDAGGGELFNLEFVAIRQIFRVLRVLLSTDSPHPTDGISLSHPKETMGLVHDQTCITQARRLPLDGLEYSTELSLNPGPLDVTVFPRKPTSSNPTREELFSQTAHHMRGSDYLLLNRLQCESG